MKAVVISWVLVLIKFLIICETQMQRYAQFPLTLDYTHCVRTRLT